MPAYRLAMSNYDFRPLASHITVSAQARGDSWPGGSAPVDPRWPAGAMEAEYA